MFVLMFLRQAVAFRPNSSSLLLPGDLAQFDGNSAPRVIYCSYFGVRIENRFSSGAIIIVIIYHYSDHHETVVITRIDSLPSLTNAKHRKSPPLCPMCVCVLQARSSEPCTNRSVSLY